MSGSDELSDLAGSGDGIAETSSHLPQHSVRTGIPLTTRLAHEIPRPKDWQALQRGCVLLFRDELRDPNTMEYGRGGQDQSGIDVLGRRNANASHYVGVQCRRVAKPLKKVTILADCRAALQLEANLQEIIFATTADDYTGATNAAVEVEKLLREEGNDLTVSIYGWQSLQTLIALHENAYAFFFPAAVSTTAPQHAVIERNQTQDLADQIALQVSEQLRLMGVVTSPAETAPGDLSSEDPALHARIDTFRDLLRQQQPLLAQKGLLALREKESMKGKPWARYRLEANLGSIALELGREQEAAAHFEAAHELRPEDPNANANLALARTVQGRYAEAMELARKALNGTPRADHAVGYLLQAAARSNFDGDPLSLIPNDLIDSSHADLGLAEFYSRKNFPDWGARNRALARRHPEVPEFKRIGAVATLAMLIDSGTIPGGRSPISFQELNSAADDMRAVAEHCLDVGFSDRHDLVAYLNNSAVLLRLAGRQAECESLLIRAGAIVKEAPQLRRLLALSQLSQGRANEALMTIGADDDPESRLFAADLTGTREPAKGLEMALAIDVTSLNPALAGARWRLIGELSLMLKKESMLREAVEALRGIDPHDISAELLLLRQQRDAGADEDTIQDRLLGIASAVPSNIDLPSRYQLAEQLRKDSLPEEAAALLEPLVDLERPGPLTTLYLQSLAAARRDEAFRQALEKAAPDVRNSPDVLWATATHAWNMGDLPSASAAIDKIRQLDPADAEATLLKIEILLRQNQSTEIIGELEKFPEKLPFHRLKDRFRIASLLGHFGFMERAASLAYWLFLENRDRSQAWMTLSALVLEEGRAAEGDRPWDVQVVAPHAAVDIRYDDGEQLFLVVEPDVQLRRLDNEAWEPDHPLVAALSRLNEGSRFVDPSGRAGQIIKLRHKYVARLHYVMEHHETRFPEILGFRKLSLDFEHPDGLNDLIAELKQRHDWVKQEQETYTNGPWPIGMLAHRVGTDTIEVAAGLASQGISLKVAVGNAPERDDATVAIRSNGRQGCVLDLLSFWTAWRLQALNAVKAVCGPINVPQSVVDRLRARREQIEFSVKDGLRTARYENGRLAATEVAPQVVREWLDDVDKALAWVGEHAAVCPLVATDKLPEVLRDFLRGGRTDIFDSLVVSVQKRLLFVTDDLPTREFGRIFGHGSSAWLHQVLGAAVDQRHIDFDTFIRWSAGLIDSGHNYLGISGVALTRSLYIDAKEGGAPGNLYRTLTKVIGGRVAEPRSHTLAVLECIRALWTDAEAISYRKPATGLLLERLIRERQDYAPMLRAVHSHIGDLPALVDYLTGWVRGHFLPADTLRSAS